MIEALVIGAAAGLVAGLLGVGGGILFVPALAIFLDHSQVDAEATSLLAIVPVAALGTWSQHRYGNVDLRVAGTLGVLAIGGAAGGVAIANAVPEDVLKTGFAAFLLFVAVQLARRATGAPPTPEDRAPGPPSGRHPAR